jgi:ribosomal-protein-alanine N-acetyltransferase
MEAQPIVIREFRPADAAPIMEIQQASPAMAQWRAADYERVARNPHGIVLIGIGSGAPNLVAGFLAAISTGEEAEIQNVAVRLDCRRRGIARALIEEAHRRLGARGVRSMFLEVRRSNTAARALYSHLGYAECGLRRRYYTNDGEDALVLRRELGPAPEKAR